jgi:predicted phage terminase large subunit-like protein
MLTESEEIELLMLLEQEEKEKEQQQIEKARNDYAAYVELTHKNIYQHTPQGDYICKVLNDAIEKRHQMKRGEIPLRTQYIKFSLPPQHGKSMHITETFPSYFLGHFPEEGVIEVSYNDTFASKFGSRNKDKITLYGNDLFGISISKDTNAKGEWEVIDTKTGRKTRGGMISRGIMSGITGSSLGDCIIIDDPIKNREEANSEVYREKVWQEWQDSISTRIHPGAIVILIMTRWHEDDLWGRLDNPEYAKPLNWQNHNLPLEAEDNDLLGRAVGEPLWPERYGYEFIEERKRYPQSFNALYQGRPTSQEGNMIKRDWWQYYDNVPQCIQYIMSVDSNYKDEDTSVSKKTDPVCIQVWGKRGADMYLLDNWVGKVNFTTTLQQIRNMLQKWPVVGAKFIEDKANGTAIINVLNKEIGGFIPVQTGREGKIARVYAVSPWIESRNVWLPRQADWVHDFVEECASFPNGTHDDQVDAMSQALNRFIYYSASIPVPQRQHFNFDFEKPKPDAFVGSEIDRSYIDF